MSDIQRWEWDTGYDRHVEWDDGKWVTYADHVEALRQAEQRGYERGYVERENNYGPRYYEQGQRDALAKLDDLTELLNRQKIVHAELIGPSHPVLIEVSRVEAAIAEIKGDSDE